MFTEAKNQNNQIEVVDEKFNLFLTTNTFKNIFKPIKISYNKIKLENNENSYIYKKYDGFIIKIIKLVSPLYLYKKDLKGNYRTNLESCINNFKLNRIDEYLNHFC